MILKSPEKHLTDQEFFTYAKFFDLVIEKKDLDDDEDTFSIRDLTVGELLRICMTKSIKSIRTKYRPLKLKCPSTQKLITITKQPLLRCFL